MFTWLAVAVLAIPQIKIAAEPDGKGVIEMLGRLYKNKGDVTVDGIVDRDAGFGPLIKGKLALLHLAGDLEENDRTAYGLVAVTYARMPVAIVTHAGVKVHNLSEKQLCQVFSGKVTNWKALGGADLPIVVETVPEGVLTKALKARVDCFASLEAGSNAVYNVTTDNVIDAIKKDAGAIGFITLPDAVRHKLSIVSVGGIAPTVPTYEIDIPLTLIVTAEPTYFTKDFVAFTKSEQTVAVLKDNGLHPPK